MTQQHSNQNQNNFPITNNVLGLSPSLVGYKITSTQIEETALQILQQILPFATGVKIQIKEKTNPKDPDYAEIMAILDPSLDEENLLNLQDESTVQMNSFITGHDRTTAIRPKKKFIELIGKFALNGNLSTVTRVNNGYEKSVIINLDIIKVLRSIYLADHRKYEMSIFSIQHHMDGISIFTVMKSLIASNGGNKSKSAALDVLTRSSPSWVTNGNRFRR